MPFLSGVWAKIAAVGTIVFAILAAAAKIFSAGKTAAREQGQREQLRNVKIRSEVDDRVERAPDPELERLRDKWTRP